MMIQSEGMYMKLHKNAYWGESLGDLKRTVTYELKYKKFAVGYYCITLPDNSENLMDIIPGEQLKLKFLRRKPRTVIGIAGTKNEAMKLAGTIIYDVYKETDGFDVTGYFSRH